MQEYVESQEREVNRYLDEIKDKAIAKAHDMRIKEGLAFFEIDSLQRDVVILDVGCRDGRQIEILGRMGFIAVIGIELIGESVKLCNQKGLWVTQEDVHELSSRKRMKVDVVIATHVIEHCYDPELAIKEIRKVLKDKGLLFIEVPINRNDKKGEWGHYVNFKDSNDVFSYCDGFEIIKQKDSKNTARLVLKKT